MTDRRTPDDRLGDLDRYLPPDAERVTPTLPADDAARSRRPRTVFVSSTAAVVLLMLVGVAVGLRPFPTDPMPAVIVQDTATMPPLLTVEGVIDAIDGLRITISGFDVVLRDGHPLLAVLVVGDMVRLRGDLLRDGGVMLVTVESLVLANEDAADNAIEIGPDGEIWRENAACDNAPPHWAVARVWRARCERDDNTR